MDGLPFLATLARVSPAEGYILRLADGTSLKAPSGARVAACDNPELIRPIHFERVSDNDHRRAVAKLLTFFREEATTAEERRQWGSRAGVQLDKATPEFEELLKFRYEEFKGERDQELRATLEAAVRNGDPHHLIDILAPSVPTTARKIAVSVALELKTPEVILSLCSAALHKTQLDFARTAWAALYKMAPARLPLLARHVKSRLGDMPEAVRAERVSERLDAMLRGGSEVVELPGEIALLLLGLPLTTMIEYARKLAQKTEFSASLGKIIEAELRPLLNKASPDSYESILGVGLAYLLIAASWGGSNSEINADSLRLVVRQGQPEDLAVVASLLPDPMAVRLVRQVLGAKDSRFNLQAILGGAIKGRDTVLQSLGKDLLALLRTGTSGDLDLRLVLFRILGELEAFKSAIAPDLARELNIAESADARMALAQVIVLNRIEISLNKLNQFALEALWIAVARASAEQAGDFISALLVHAREAASGLTTWDLLSLPPLDPTKVGASGALSEELINWIDVFLANWSQASNNVRTSFIVALLGHASKVWSTLPDLKRFTLLSMVEEVDPAVALQLLTAVRQSDGTSAALAKAAVRAVLSRLPEALPEIAEWVPEQDLTLVILSQLAEAKAVSNRGSADSDAARAEEYSLLQTTLHDAIAQAVDATRLDDNLRILYENILERLNRAGLESRATKIRDSYVAAYLEEFGAEKGGSVASRADALTKCVALASSRSRASKDGISFFKAELHRLLEEMAGEEILDFLKSRAAAVKNLDSTTLYPIVEALLRKQGRKTISSIVALFPASSATAMAIELAVSASSTDMELGTEILRSVGVTNADLVSVLSLKFGEARDSGVTADGISSSELLKDLTPFLEAVESVVLNYMRVRRALRQVGFPPVENELAGVRQAEELVAGAHAIVGTSRREGSFEILSFGVRSQAANEVISPSKVSLIDTTDGELNTGGPRKR